MNKLEYFVSADEYNFEKPIVGKGKFAPKSQQFFSNIEKFQKNMPKEYLVKPLTLEFEITNKCNQKCLHCGMHSNLIEKCETLTKEQISKIVEECSNYGVPSISLTGGEPFLVFDDMLQAMKECRKFGVDICKISSNGFWGINSEKYFNKLEGVGFFNNKYFVPCLMLSIGEQKVPFSSLFNIIDYCIEKYTQEDITLCISSLNEIGKLSKVEEFISEYEKTGKEFPKGRIYLTENYYVHNENMIDNQRKKLDSVEYFLNNCVRCFNQKIGTYVNPRLMMKVSGETYSCACFNISKHLSVGNVLNDGLKKVLDNLNNNKYVQMIARSGFEEFKNKIPYEIRAYNRAENFCDACAFCIDYLEYDSMLDD